MHFTAKLIMILGMLHAIIRPSNKFSDFVLKVDYSVNNGIINEWVPLVQSVTLKNEPNFRFTQVTLHENSSYAGLAAGVISSLINKGIFPKYGASIRQSLMARKLVFWIPAIATYDYFAADSVQKDIVRPCFDYLKNFKN